MKCGDLISCDTRTVDMHVQRIRRKLDEDKDKSIIETVLVLDTSCLGKILPGMLLYENQSTTEVCENAPDHS